MARSSMTDLITRLRELTSASAGEFTINGVDYFTDDQLQATLESYSTIHMRVAIYPVGEYRSNAMSYSRYPLPYYLVWVEGAGDGSLWQLVDGNGDDAPPHILALTTRQIIFDAPTDGRTITAPLILS